MTLDQFINKYKGIGVDFDGHYGDQCVDLIRQYIKEVLVQPQPRGVTGAKDFWANYETDQNLNKYFTKIPNTPDGVPQKGDIIIWGAYGNYGHIAIINWANASQFQALSQNDPIGSKTVLKNYSYKSILGWFHPEENMSDLSVCLEQHTQLVDKLNKLEGQLAIIKKELAKTQDQLKEANKKRVDAEKELKVKQTEIVELNQTIFNENKEFVTAQKKHSQMVDELTTHIKQLESDQINESEVVATFLDKVIEGLDGYGGEKTLEGVLNSMAQREADSMKIKKELELLKSNPIIRLILIIKGLIK